MRSLTAALPLGMLGMLGASFAISSPVSPFNDLLIDAANTTAADPDFTHPPIANISNYANGSLFYHWRPRAHFIHPSNQLGDPTAFWQAADGTAHITALYSFLRGTGNASLFTSGFSGSTTRDFLQYDDLSGWENPVQMGPGNAVDFIADFDGSVVADGYKGLPTLMWTAVKGIPISWTIPYTDGYESQALAYSKDNGTTWTKLDAGADVAVIPRPPYAGNVVTGFRDPYLFRNSAFDRLLNVSSSDGEPMHYVTLSSGLHPAMPGLPGVEFEQAGPRIWLYRQNTPGDWLNWTFCGPLLQSRINTTFTTPASGWAATDYSDGNNYETSQIANLDFGGDASLETGMAYVSYGAESNHTLMLYRLGHWVANRGAEATSVNATLAEGVRSADAGVEMQTALEGVLDWGLAYACTGLRYESPQNETVAAKARRIVYCWIKEAFANQDATKFATEYISSLTLPRQLYLKKIANVVNNELILQNASWAILNSNSNLTADSKIETIPADDFVRSPAAQNKTVDLVMLGISPAVELLELRANANDSFHLPDRVELSAANVTDSNSSDGGAEGLKWELRRGVPSGNADVLVDELFVPLPRHPASKHFEVATTIHFPLGSLRNSAANASFAAGISILRSPNSTANGEDVAIVYQPSNESVIIQRRTALGPASVLTNPETGKLRLWQLESPNTTTTNSSAAVDEVEALQLRVFVDGSAVEVYINDVFVLTTRAYYWYPDSVQLGFVYQLPHNSIPNNQQLGDMHVTYTNTTWWEGLIDAYPDRPKDKAQLIKMAQGYPEPTDNPNRATIIYNGTGPAPPFPHLG